MDDELPVIWPPSFYHRDRHVIFLFHSSFPVHRVGVGHSLFTPPTAFFVKLRSFKRGGNGNGEGSGLVTNTFLILNIAQQSLTSSGLTDHFKKQIEIFSALD